MGEKTYSIQRIFTRNLAFLIVTSVLFLLFFGGFSYWSGVRQTQAGNEASLNVYINTLETEMNSLSDYIRNTCYNDTAYQLLSTGYDGNNERIIYDYNLRNQLKAEVAPYSGLLVFSNVVSTSMFQFGSSFPASYAKHCYELKEELKSYWTNAAPADLEHWQTYSNEYFSVLMYASQYNGLYMCAVIDLNLFAPQQYSPSGESLNICFLDDRGLLSNQQGMAALGLDYTDLTSDRNPHLFNPKIFARREIAKTDISIVCVMDIDYMDTYFRVSVICIILLLSVFCGMFLYMYLSFKDILRYPLEQITSASVSLKQNDIDLFLENNKTKIIEFQKLNTALSDLLHQKIQLEQENQLEKFEKNHARLQYFQLQTSSHFFINCLKSLYSMLASKEYEKMQRMILAFSNHLRYIFHDTLQMVTLKMELEEVNDYYNIILMDHSKPILLMQDIDEDLYDFQVPPLLIQTFLENSIKYNAQSDKLLCFTIHVEKAQLEGMPAVLFRLSDNGTGYDDNMLEKLNLQDTDLFSDYQVGISNLKKRIQIIYKSGFRFAFFNAPTGGACSLIYLPMEEE